MPNVRISTDWQHPGDMQWSGAPLVDADNHVERSLPIPEEAYQRIEAAIAGGHLEGDIFLKDRSRFHWFLDR